MALVTVLHVGYYFPRVVDDLFISLRYAENLAHGHGAVYNLGERVEGYSGPSWMLLQSIGLALGAEGVTWTKCAGLGCLFVLEYSLFLLARVVLKIRGALAYLPVLCCALNSYVVNWSILGLETPLHLAAIAFGAAGVGIALQTPTRRSKTMAGAGVFLLGTTRPESLLYVAAIAFGALVSKKGEASLRTMLSTLVQVFIPAAGLLTCCLLARWSYYGHLVPNTYFVKGAYSHFDISRLGPLWMEGASGYEALLFVGGALFLAYFGWKRGAVALPLIVLGNLYFTCSVVRDWMPSLRHLLPTTALAPLGLAALADEMWHARRLGRGRWLFLLPIGIVVVGSIWMVQIDNRYSVEEKRDGEWILPKSTEKLRDTLLAYQRIEPPHVTRMGPYEMGQISLCWGVLEASDEPLESTWVAGRDIGAVGYYTGAKVFDTAGLFTPAVSGSRAWTQRHEVTTEMVNAMMSLRPVAGEVFEGWESALGRQPGALTHYRIRHGSSDRPTAWIANDRHAPRAQEIVHRYDAMVDKFPSLYHLHTLYGEAVGAAVRRRAAAVRKEMTEHGASARTSL